MGGIFKHLWHSQNRSTVLAKEGSLALFIYSEKATKFCEISTILLSYVVPVKSKVEISQNLVAFSYYINFNSKSFLLFTWFCLEFYFFWCQWTCKKTTCWKRIRSEKNHIIRMFTCQNMKNIRPYFDHKSLLSNHICHQNLTIYISRNSNCNHWSFGICSKTKISV